MEHQKIIKSLNESNDSKFVTRKWIVVNDQSNSNCDVGNEFIYDIEIIKSNLCDFNHSYMLIRDYITVKAAPEARVPFEICVAFTKCIMEIDGATADDAEDLDLAMAMYNLIKYSSNFSQTT